MTGTEPAAAEQTGGEASGSGTTAGQPGSGAAAAEHERLRRENEKLTAELARAQAALEVMERAHALLEQLSESAGANPNRTR